MKKHFISKLKYLLNFNLRYHFIVLRFLLLLLPGIFIAPQTFAALSVLKGINVSVKQTDVPLSKILSEIEYQTGYSIIVRLNDVDVDEIYSIEEENKSLPQVFAVLFRNKEVEYEINDNTISIFKKVRPDTNSVTQSGFNIKGTITDPSGEPVVGANIVDKVTRQGTISDQNGDFTLTVSDNTVLVVTYIGYIAQEIPIKDRGAIHVILQEDFGFLDEVVVIGFQTQKKINVTGAISSVGKEVFENRPVSNMGQALQGVIPNLNINISSGNPNEAPNINLRGGTSLSYNSNTSKYEMVSGSPLILVDGVEISSQQLNQMNPNDIASLSVLKDLSSAAIYGTRANDGVIIITTKSGAFDQKPKISYSYDISFETPSNIPDILDSYSIQRAAMDKKLFTNKGESTDDLNILEAMAKYRDNPTPENAYILQGGTIRWVASTNPYDELVRDWAPTQKHNFSVSGGSSKVTYYVSLGYVDKEGLYKFENDEYKRYNASASITAKITNWFNVNAKATYNQTDYKSPFLPGAKGTLWTAMKGHEVDRNINTPLLTGPNDPIPNALTENILNYMKGPYENYKNTTTILTISPEFIVIPEQLKIKADLSFTPTEYEKMSVLPEQGRVWNNWNTLSTDHTQYNNAWQDKTSTKFLTFNAYAEYNKSFLNKHNLNVLIGYNQEKETFSGLYASYARLISSDIINPGAVEDKTLNSISNSLWNQTARAGFGRISYDYRERYLFTVNARYDGSSRFPKEDRFQFFPTFSVGWKISEEKFMRATHSVLNNLMVRGSWGKLGSQPGSRYPYQSVLSTGNAGYMLDGSYPGAIFAPGLVSPSLQWPETTTLNLGLDWNLLNNRLTGTFDIFSKKVDKILTDGTIKYPGVLGASAPLQNSGEIKGKGWELVLNWRDRLQSGLSYSIGVSLGDSQNEVVQYAGNPEKQIGSLYAGQKIGEIWGYETGGILQESDFDGVDTNGFPIFNGPDHTAITSQLFPGMIWYKDLNHDGKINTGDNTVDNPGDRKIIGNSTPRYRYGITANVSYKGFDLNLFFDGIGKRDLWLSGSSYWGGSAGSKWMLERSWRPDRTDAKYPMYMADGVVAQSGYLVNGAYFRMKQMILGYTLPRNISAKIGSEKIRFNVSGYNLFEITGLSRNFSVDNLSDVYPHMRSYSLGVQVEF